MKNCDIRVTLGAVQTDLAEDFTVTLFRRETAVIILNIAGRHHDVVGNLYKIMVIAAIGTDYPAKRLACRYLDFLHRASFTRRPACALVSVTDGEPRRSIAGFLFICIHLGDLGLR